MKNYRPVSNLLYVSKLLEKVVANQIMTYMYSNDLHDPLQSAHRPGHNTETAMLKIKNDIDVALDQGEGVLLVLLDLSAAFDTIDHKIMLSRLKFYCGITRNALKWFKSYMENRTQTVLVNGSKSEPVNLTTGVPQGYVLGPLLFSIYMLPLCQIMRNHGILFHGYADDTQLYIRFRPGDAVSLADAIRRLEMCIKEIRMWMTANKLKLNDGKTDFMVIVSAYYRQLITSLEIAIKSGNTNIHPTMSVKNLGVTLDTNMTMHPHVNQIVRTAYFHLRAISRIRRFINYDTCASVVQALVISRLDYANAVLIGLPENTLRKLQLV